MEKKKQSNNDLEPLMLFIFMALTIIMVIQFGLTLYPISVLHKQLKEINQTISDPGFNDKKYVVCRELAFNFAEGTYTCIE